MSRGDPFYTLMRSIIGQQISVKAADALWVKFEHLAKNIAPKSVLSLDEEQLRGCGLSRQKAHYVHIIAQHFMHNGWLEREWHDVPDDQIRAELTAIKGIGPWTAEMFLIFALLRPDVFPLGDIGLRKAMEKHYFAGEKQTTAVLETFGERWRPYRTVATWYLWRSLDPVPVEY